MGKGEQFFKGQVNEERCVGCLLCQFSCSLHAFGQHLPLGAYITVARAGSGGYRISFTEECDNCFLCITHCAYGCLEKI